MAAGGAHLAGGWGAKLWLVTGWEMSWLTRSFYISSRIMPSPSPPHLADAGVVEKVASAHRGLVGAVWGPALEEGGGVRTL